MVVRVQQVPRLNYTVLQSCSTYHHHLSLMPCLVPSKRPVGFVSLISWLIVTWNWTTPNMLFPSSLMRHRRHSIDWELVFCLLQKITLNGSFKVCCNVRRSFSCLQKIVDGASLVICKYTFTAVKTVFLKCKIKSSCFFKLSSEAMTTYYFPSCTAVRACVRACVRASRTCFSKTAGDIWMKLLWKLLEL
jgi:hypothetical protein